MIGETPTSADGNAQPFELIEPFERIKHHKPLTLDQIKKVPSNWNLFYLKWWAH